MADATSSLGLIGRTIILGPTAVTMLLNDFRKAGGAHRYTHTGRSFQAATILDSPDQTLASIGRQGVDVPGLISKDTRRSRSMFE
jgi:hypothetical protein